MPNVLTWMRGSFDPIAVEIDFLKSKLLEARRVGDTIQENIIINNLRGLGYKAVG